MATLLSHCKPPWDWREKTENVSSFRRFEGTEKKKKIHLMRPWVFSLSGNKILQILLPDAFWRRLSRKDERWKYIHNSWTAFYTHTHTETLKACFLRQLLAGYHKVNHCYLDNIKSLLLNKLDITAIGCTFLWLLPPRFNCIHLYLHLITSRL